MLSSLPPQGLGAAASTFLEFLEKITVAANSQNQDFAATLDGDTDGAYVVVGSVVNNGSGAAILSLQPNALTTNMVHQRLTGSSTSATAAANTDALRLSTPANTAWCSFFAVFHARKVASAVAKPRFYWCFDSSPNVLGTSHFTVLRSGHWNETSTNVTSIRIASDIANGIGAGSELFLYKLRGW